ncbi:hypothetical protein BJ508DRAFT_375991 [Ascobolus immersus RN42]|uniref:Uncharacterized protein n=1 Tax=Ascobolus immersus RN42 TaxID=1160509 RepID=A0A3N4IBQ2_ASCIM|nr:hypothetical protein BJ508DRAFT_375991 [Ascobolus immersus RN42]
MCKELLRREVYSRCKRPKGDRHMSIITQIHECNLSYYEKSLTYSNSPSSSYSSISTCKTIRPSSKAFTPGSSLSSITESYLESFPPLPSPQIQPVIIRRDSSPSSPIGGSRCSWGPQDMDNDYVHVEVLEGYEPVVIYGRACPMCVTDEPTTKPVTSIGGDDAESTETDDNDDWYVVVGRGETEGCWGG